MAMMDTQRNYCPHCGGRLVDLLAFGPGGGKWRREHWVCVRDRMTREPNVRWGCVKVPQGARSLRVDFGELLEQPDQIGFTPSWVTLHDADTMDVSGFSLRLNRAAPSESTVEWCALWGRVLVVEPY